MATPPINAVGTYTVRLPFIIEPGHTYKCEAIQGFESFKDVDVYKKFYQQYGLSEAQYTEDQLNSVDIVTLVSPQGPMVVLPSSYIIGFPAGDSVPYNQVYLTFDLSILPDKFNLSLVQNLCIEVISDIVGVDASAHVVVHPLAGVLSVSDHEKLVNARMAKVKKRDTFKKLLSDSLSVEQELRQRNALLEQELAKRI